MVLNGDILEYQNVGPMEDVEGIQADIDLAGIELLINFMEFAWAQWSYTSVMRLNGGGASTYFQRERMESFSKTMNDRLESRDSKLRSKIRNRKIVKAARRFGPLVGGAGGIAYTGLTWKKIGQEKRAKRAREKFAAKNPFGDTYDFDFMDEPEQGERAKQQNDNITRAVEKLSIEMSTKAERGRNMLEWKNSLTRMLKTHMEYRMSVVKVTQVVTKYQATTPWWTTANVANHSTMPGNGPCLYTVFDDTVKIVGDFTGTTGNRNVKLWEPELSDYGWTESYTEWKTQEDAGRLNYRGLGVTSPVYFMNVDWIGTFMSPFTVNQTELYKNETTVAPATESGIITNPLPSYMLSQRNGNLLQYKYVDYNTTTDLNLPVQAATIMNTKDWTYLTHYYTKYNFKFRNFSRRRYCVEILCFKFKADIETFTYQRICEINVSRQKAKTQDYMDNITDMGQDMKQIWRKRILIDGMKTPYTGDYFTNTVGSNVKNWKYIHRRKYVIKRPVLNTYETVTERHAYNTYYDHENACYFRIQGWPVCPNVNLDTGAANGVVMNPNEDVTCVPSAAGDLGTVLSAGVDVVIDKKCYFKLDEPMYKNYAPS